MSNLTRGDVLKLADLYVIEINEDSKEHLVEDINGNITEFNRQDIPELIGINPEKEI